MSASLSRRALATGLLTAAAVPANVAAKMAPTFLRGDDTPRLPAHADLWARMPLPFTPVQAWRLLSPETQAEIGAAVIGQYLAGYVSGQMHEDEADLFLDESLREAAGEAAGDILNRMDDRLWAILPDLYGPDGDHPAWAHAAGMVLPLGAVVPERRAAPVAVEADPVLAAIKRASDAEAAFTAALAALPDDHTEAEAEAAERVGFASDAAADALLSTRPTTFDGLVAQLRYLGETVITDGGRSQIVRLADLLADGPPID